MNTRELQEITNDTLKEVRNYEIVTPDFFSDTFYEKAIIVNPDMQKEEISKNNIENTLVKVLHIQKETKEHTNELKENINEATVAISNKDDKSLGEVQTKIDDLYKRILQLEEQVYIDELTKVQNRKWLFEKLLHNDLFKNNGTLTFLDIDKFKNINDSYGHVAGDKVLLMIASLVSKLPNSKTIRYGGDEFIIVSKSENQKSQEKFFETINKNLAKKNLNYQGELFRVGISYGCIDYKAGENFNDVIEKVDKMMYEHKKLRASLLV